MHELHRRLATPELAQDLPGTLLMKVAMDYVKHLEKRNEIEEAKLALEKLDPLEMVDQPGLPLVLRMEVLSEYLDELDEARRAAGARAISLYEEFEQSEQNDEVVPEVQELVPEAPGV